MPGFSAFYILHAVRRRREEYLFSRSGVEVLRVYAVTIMLSGVEAGEGQKFSYKGAKALRLSDHEGTGNIYFLAATLRFMRSLSC